MRHDVDVLIAGGRCAGAATALLLAQAGVRVLIVEKGAYGSDTLSTHALMRGAVMQLHRWGVLRHIQESSAPPVRTTTFGYPSGDVTVAIEPRYGVEAMYAPRRAVLDRVLADAAAAAGAEFVFGSTLGELRHDDQGHVRGAHVRDERGARWISAPLVIGADGLHSRVARRAGAANLLSGASTAANLYSYWEGLDLAGYEWRYDATSSVGAIPTNDGLACVFVSVPDRELTRVARPTATAGYEHFLRTRFAPFAERLAGARRVEPVRGFGGHRGFLKQSAGPGWALVGDAGYFKDPITAHGITDALRDAELLARAILAGSQDALDNYHALRHDLSQELFAITDRIASFTWREDELQALHRGFSREMAREQRALAALEPFSWQSPLVNVPVAV